ncbi:rhodanese-like domain-containing protein [Aquimarina sp. MMG016]|uniref:rhodanese-like domain-containing protein n=1 Tax=Aquimarina sp. MMG016 TaxID=2822690 RepID=UPI001B39D1EC|nr:rhodanese-like domain-containing protein [Aquimarina sp. MMG016]MBQ4820430.1 rhodanese-like domain-containing protein [Aquimarina sp. MMG016]
MKIKPFLLIAFISLAFLSCKEKQTEGDSVVELITVEEMDSLLDMGKVQLIDVRTPKEYNEGHIEGATNIDFRDENFKDLIDKADKSKPVAVYCGRGGRSGKCSTYMKKAGFTKIYDLDGGITEWKFKGKKVVK